MGRKAIDLTGQRFGSWTVLREVEERDKHGAVVWECLCVCGNTKTVVGGRLRNGASTSCGCRGSISVGKKYGRLTTVERLDKRDDGGNTFWKCKCECGNSIEVRAYSLTGTRELGCGCQSKRNHKVANDVNRKMSWKEGTSLNQLTNKIPSNNTSGVKGVSWDKRSERWIANLKFKGHMVLWKYFENKQDAIDARKAAEEKYFKPILEKYGKNI